MRKLPPLLLLLLGLASCSSQVPAPTTRSSSSSSKAPPGAKMLSTGYLAQVEYGVRYLPISRAAKPDNCIAGSHCDYTDTNGMQTHWTGTRDDTYVTVSPSPGPSQNAQCVVYDSTLGAYKHTACVSGGGSGTVTSVDLVCDKPEFYCTGGPVTTVGALHVSPSPEPANMVYAGPTSGGLSTPAFRSLVSGDLPAGAGLPSQGGNSGKFLTTDGANASWATVSSGVTSVSNSDGTLTISPTTGAVVASLATGHANNWSAAQTFSVAPVFSAGLSASGSSTNDFSGSSGSFATSSGTNTLNGTVVIASNKSVSCAAGTTSVDLSAGTGTLKLPTGGEVATRTADAAITQYALTKAATTAGRFIAVTVSDLSADGVAATSASGAASSFTQWEMRGQVVTVISDGVSAINPGDYLSVSTTTAGDVTKGTGAIVCKATASAAATPGTTLACVWQ
jgi:hypothetical protein